MNTAIATVDQINKAFGSKQKRSAVAICYFDNQVLLGLARADDDRDGKWCFVGGGIEEGESSIEAASRELYEEAGIIAAPITMTCITHPNKPNVFFHLFRTQGQELTPNEEFIEMKWFSMNGLMPDNLYPINYEILQVLKNSHFIQ